MIRGSLSAAPPMIWVVLASVSFAVGGICMKHSDGLARWPWAIGVFALFILGAGLQTLAMPRGDLGVIYVIVLGLEAVLAFGFGAIFFHEVVTPLRLVAIALIVGGISLLR